MIKTENALDEIIKRYSHRMPFPEKAKSLMGLYLQKGRMPKNDWDILALSLLASISEPLFLHLHSKDDLISDFFELTRNKENLSPSKMKDSLQRKIFSSSKEPENILNDFRLVRLSAIVVLDILSILNFEEVCSALSDLSDAVVSTAVYLAEHNASNKMGIPYHKDENGKLVKTKFVFFALGKWGGRELNYSSDIDLITFYEEEGKTDKGFSNSDYFEKIVKNVFEILSSESLSLGGFKVDFNLRPRGKDGKLTIPIKSAFEYYKTKAQFWEKQCWIKARPFYGDVSLGGEFVSKIQKLILEDKNLSSCFKEIINSRNKTLANILEKKRDLKEGEGSIRDIEFAVQALSMASSSSSIEGNTLKAIHLLREKNFLTPKDEEELRKSYEVLRKAEHFVQVVNLRQTRLEPNSEKDWEGLKKFLSSKNPKELIFESRKLARAFFQKKLLGLIEGDRRKIREEDIAKDLKERQFEKVETILPLLCKIYKYLLSFENFSDKEIEDFHQKILNFKIDEKSFLKGLKGFESIISSDDSYNLLLSDSKIFSKNSEKLFKIVSLSPPLSEYLKTIPETISPLLKEDFSEIDFKNFSKKTKNAEIREISLEQKKIFVKSIAKRIFLNDEDYCETYSSVAEEIVKTVFERTAKEFSDWSESSNPLSKIAVFSLGRLGFKEMVFGSDLDLLIVKKDDKDSPTLFSDSLENKFARAFIENLSSLTSSGNLYEVDLRLRPFGNSGVLIPSEETIKKYFKKDARLWEKLSYIKLRFLCGNRNVAKKVYSSVLESFNQVNSHSLSEVKVLIRRLLKTNQNLEGEIKFKEGGLFDQDLFVAALINNIGKFDFGGGFLNAIEFLKEEKILTEDEISLLKEAKRFFLNLLYDLRIYSAPHKKPKTQGEFSFNFWDKASEEKFRKEIALLINSHFPNLL